MENLIIDGNKIREPGVFGEIKYFIVNNEVREKFTFGRRVYVLDGNEIKEPGFSGKTVYVIDGNKIKKAPEKPKSFVSEVVGAVLSAGNTNKVKPSGVKESENKSYSPNKTEEKRETPASQFKKPVVKTAEELKRERIARFEAARREEVEKQKKKYLIGAFVLGFFIIFFIGMLAFEYSNVWYFKELHAIYPDGGFMKEVSAANTRVVFLWIIVISQIIGEIVLIKKRAKLS